MQTGQLIDSVIKNVTDEINSAAETQIASSGLEDHVLIVDDKNGPRQALRMLLKEEHKVYVAGGVEEALKVVEDTPINLVITDLRMPKQTGVDLLCKIKKQNPEIQVIILTGYGQLDSAMKAVEHGAFAYMEKPFDNYDMLEHVRAGIAKYRQERERRILEDLALEANRFETIGRVVGGMVHDLGTPLSVLNGELELLKLKKKAEDLPERLDTMLSQVHHCTDMVRTTMGLLRSETQGAIHLSLNAILEACLELSTSSMRNSGVTVETDLALDLQATMGDPVLVRQAAMNLLNNACQAMQAQSENRKIVIRTWNEDHAVCLSVADTGPGIPEADWSKVFDTFYTTKGKDGTGLGLAVVRNVMTRHCGSVTVGENGGQGAVFTLRFPCPNKQ